jgi:hypothetical protein
MTDASFPDWQYGSFLLGGLLALAIGLMSWKASRHSISVTFLLLMASATLAWLLFWSGFRSMFAPMSGRGWYGLAIACALPAPLLSLAGVIRWAGRERVRAWHYLGGILLVALFYAMALNVMEQFMGFDPAALFLAGLILLTLAVLSWRMSWSWVPATILLLLAGSAGVWGTATLQCPGDLVIAGELRYFSNPPFGCGPLMPFILPLPVLSALGLVQWVMRRKTGEHAPSDADVPA